MFWYQLVGVNVAMVPISVETMSGPEPVEAARLYFCTTSASGTSVRSIFSVEWVELNDFTSAGRKPTSSARAHICSVSTLGALRTLAALTPPMLSTPKTMEVAANLVNFR